MNTRDVSDKQEKGISKKFGTKEQIASGATPFYKGDGVDTYLFIEAKSKMKPSESHSLKKEWFEKAKKQAAQMRKGNYILVFNFGEVSPYTGMYKDYVAMEDSYFEHLYKSSKVLDEIVESLGTLDDLLLDTKEIKLLKRMIREGMK